MDGEPVPTMNGPEPHPAHPGLRSIRRESVFLAVAVVLVVILGGLGLYYKPTPSSLKGTAFDPDAVTAASHAQARPAHQ